MCPNELIISLVTWNHEETIKDCINSILSQTYSEYLLYICDNASSDKTVELIKQIKDDRIRLFENKQNTGFCGGHNMIINSTEGKYVLLINPDIVLRTDYLRSMLARFEQLDESVGAMCGLLLQGSSSQIIDCAGLVFNKDRRFVLRYHGKNVRDVDLHQCRVDGVDGALPCYRRKMINELKVEGNFFDEMLFSHKEDWDVSWRAKLFGWVNVFVPECVAVHPRQFKAQDIGVRNKMPNVVKYHAVKNQLIIILKNDKLKDFLYDGYYIIPRQIIIFIYILFRETKSVFAYVFVAKNIKKILKNRKEIALKVVLTRHAGMAVENTTGTLPLTDKIICTTRPLRFIQVFNRYLMPGGEENSVARIADHLELAGHEVTRFWLASTEWEGRNAPSKWRQLLNTWNNKAILDQLREVHENVRPDAWIFHNLVPVISLGAYHLAKELGVPVINWLHNYRPISPSGTLRAGNRTIESDDPFLVWKEIVSGSWRSRFLTAWLALGYARIKRRGDLDAVKAWVALSDDTKRIFERAGFPSDKIHVLQHSWNIQLPISDESNGDYFLYLGRMVEEKGVKFLIQLWSRPEFRDVPLVMAGQGPLADFYRHCTSPNIRWVGFVSGEEKRRLVAGCRAVLFPCLWIEPCSTVVFEAFEQSRSVLASNVGGFKDLIIDGKTGCLLEPGNETAWLEAIQRLVREPERSTIMGENGFHWLNEHISSSSWNRKFDEILRKVMPLTCP
jgi:GT2 family glycosyltransferase